MAGPLLAKTVSSLLPQAAAAFGQKPAVSFLDGETVSFADLEERSGRFAGGLRAMGVGPGDRVVLWLSNSWEWVVAYHAIVRLGAVVVPVNHLLTAPEIEFIAQDCGALAIILPGDRAPGLKTTARLIATGALNLGTAFDDLLRHPFAPPVSASPQDMMSIGYTSGTTGKPKGAVLSHGNIAASLTQTTLVHARKAEDLIYSALPFPHVYGNIVLNSVFLSGAQLMVPGRFNAGQALRDIGALGVTLFEGVPTMYYQMLADPGLATADLASLDRCTVGGQSIPVPIIEQVVERFGCPLLELWGMTELAGPAITHAPHWPPRPGSVGRPFDGTQVRILALDGAEEVAPGEAGQLMVRGPLVMQGYWDNPEATAATLDADGWLATGDVARVDEDGYVTIVDRLKDMILTGGYNIYPAELEQALAGHPSVAMAAVAGVPDAEKGELAHAYVVLKPGAAADAEGILAHCRARLAAYKTPRAIHFVDDLPKTSTGKIMRRALKKTAEPTSKEGSPQ